MKKNFYNLFKPVTTNKCIIRLSTTYLVDLLSIRCLFFFFLFLYPNYRKGAAIFMFRKWNLFWSTGGLWSVIWGQFREEFLNSQYHSLNIVKKYKNKEIRIYITKEEKKNQKGVGTVLRFPFIMPLAEKYTLWMVIRKYQFLLIP